MLCELVRKREKLKLEFTKQTERTLNVQLFPLQASMRKVLELITIKDVNEIFLEPVDVEEVHSILYYLIITYNFDNLLGSGL